ncbi:DUF6526 family protein [Cellulophaga sp. BC115SP]|uniref:DUF6526 family protein n=1 Tax=Cellulophaga sp. BC115SP TaxID=2683263 RepID=UPI001413786F|nr:DUF6526 family protein [Cellulophaga sp. BC115SP]NBB29644.1 hypothetical protein [Cellulophaga sp. BC115SP]
MQEQNFQNHSKYVLGYHVITSVLLLGALITAIIYTIKNGSEQAVLAITLLLTIAALLGVFWYTRVFALRAQDRAIRAEENLRYFVLTGKLLPSNLRMGQIIALRFAPNEELIALVEQAATEALSAKEIKQAIQNWKPDYHRA